MSKPDENETNQAGAGDAGAQGNASANAGNPAEKDATGKAGKKSAKADKQASATIRVTARVERFRRAGLEFSRTPVDIRTADLDDDAIARLRAEPQLIVEDVEA